MQEGLVMGRQRLEGIRGDVEGENLFEGRHKERRGE